MTKEQQEFLDSISEGDLTSYVANEYPGEILSLLDSSRVLEHALAIHHAEDVYDDIKNDISAEYIFKDISDDLNIGDVLDEMGYDDIDDLMDYIGEFEVEAWVTSKSKEIQNPSRHWHIKLCEFFQVAHTTHSSVIIDKLHELFKVPNVKCFHRHTCSDFCESDY